MWWRIDLKCSACDWTKRDHFCRRSDTWPVCADCGAPTIRAWLSGAFPAVIPDDVPGGFVAENMTREPETFYSKSEWRRRMKELGVRHRDEFAPTPGSDKSKHSVRWW